ncbi:MAG: alpha/beta hydrolase [Betaproteobacteria bacterium]|nr:alpha/beta hydrolase [Betaproteobacteria bacterium]
MELLVNGRKCYFYSGGKAFDSKLSAVVFIHGAQHDHSVWVLQSRYLAHHGSSVIALDLPGHGRSEGPALASVEAIADWVVALLDGAGVARTALVGHSMGSLAALDCAARHAKRVSAIALLGCAFPMKVSPELLEATRDDEPLAQDMVNLWSHSAYAHYPSNPGPGFWVMGENLRLMQRQAPGVMHIDFRACNAYGAGLERAAQVRCPALFILGRRDVMTPARSGRELAKAIAGARVTEIPGSGHALMAEKPDEVLEALLAFFRDSRIGI